MNDFEPLPQGSVTSARGFTAGAVPANIKGTDPTKLDLGALRSATPATAAAVFTTNKVCAAPVLYSREAVRSGRAQLVVFNSGNANACTGAQSAADTERMAELAARQLAVPPTLTLVASTGVIGVPLPMARIEAGISRLALTAGGGHAAAQAIMTTDTFPKEIAVRLVLAGREVTIGGMAKGSGMIHPNMATMLAFLTTDATLEHSYADSVLRRITEATFNMLSVDGDTSTNDTLLLLANGASGAPPLRGGDDDSAAFAEALSFVAHELTVMLARDGEGATKVIEVRVAGAETVEDARRVAMAVVNSPLVKTAVYGADPNWGRIACAAGYSGAALDQRCLDVGMVGMLLLRQGEPAPFDRAAVVTALKAAAPVTIDVDLHLGPYTATGWGCDLTEGYVEINGRYTT